MEIQLSEKSSESSKAKKQLPIGLLTKKLSVYQQKIQYRHPVIQKCVFHLAQQCFHLPSTHDRLSFLQQCFQLQRTSDRLNFPGGSSNACSQHNGTTPLLTVVQMIDEAESANGSVWNDVRETWSTITEAGKFDQIGIPLCKPEQDQKHSPQTLLFKYILVHIAEHVAFPQQQHGFVLENVKHFSATADQQNQVRHAFGADLSNPNARTGSFAVAKSTMDELSRFVEAAIPLNYDALFGSDVLQEFCPPEHKTTGTHQTPVPEDVLEGPSTSVGLSTTALNFSHFAYVGFTLTSLMLRIQVLETKLDFMAKSFARHLVMLVQNQSHSLFRSKADLQTFVCRQFKDLVLTCCTLTVSLREVLLSNREKKIGPEALWNRESVSETSLSATVQAVVKEISTRVWDLLLTHQINHILSPSNPNTPMDHDRHLVFMDFRDCVVKSLKMLPNFLA